MNEQTEKRGRGRPPGEQTPRTSIVVFDTDAQWIRSEAAYMPKGSFSAHVVRELVNYWIEGHKGEQA